MNSKSILADSPPPGFYYFPDFISEPEETALLKHIEKLQWQKVKMHGITAKRKVVHFGLDYTYSSRSVNPTTPPPKFLHSLIQRGAALLKVKPTDLVEILISEYPINAGIGWHRDAPIFGDKVLGISLVSAAIMKFRIKQNEKYEIFKAEIAARSAYILSGVARTKWQHSIPPVKNIRYSITFRMLKK